MNYRKLLLLVITYTSLHANFAVSHCTSIGNNKFDCGASILGSAFFEPDSIIWNGKKATVILGGAGFSGLSYYLSQNSITAGNDLWSMTTHNDYLTVANENIAVSMGNFFAPAIVGKNSYPNLYQAQILNTSNAPTGELIKSEPVLEIEGIDDIENAIRVDVHVKVDGVEYCQNTLQCPPCEDTTPYCKDIVVNEGSEVTFIVTPKVDVTKVPATAREPKHAYTQVIYSDQATECSDASVAEAKKQSFITSNITENSFNDVDNYLHFLGAGGPTLTRNICTFQVDYLSSFNKAFTLKAINQRSTQEGYALFVFTPKAHFYFNDQDRYPGSHQSFHIKTGTPVEEIQMLAAPQHVQIRKK